MSRRERSEAHRLVLEFHRAFGVAIAALDTTALRVLRARLTEEEATEARDALLLGSPLARVAKELADQVVVAYGTAISLGIDLDEALRRVHASNMSKLGADGKPVLRGDGKVLKGPHYVEPDLAEVVTGMWPELARVARKSGVPLFPDGESYGTWVRDV